MGKGDDPNCRTSGTTARRSTEEEVTRLSEELRMTQEVLMRVMKDMDSDGRRELNSEIPEVVDQLRQMEERVSSLEKEREPSRIGKFFRKIMGDKGIYLGGTAFAAGVVTLNPVLMAVGGVAYGLNKLRHKKEAEDMEAEYLALRGGEMAVSIQELRIFKGLSREEKAGLVSQARKHYKQTGTLSPSPFGAPSLGPNTESVPGTARENPTTADTPRGAPSVDEGHEEFVEDGFEEDVGSESNVPEEVSVDQIAAGHAEMIRRESVASLDKEIEDILRMEQREVGEDWADEMGDAAIHARKLMLISRSQAIPEGEEGKEIRRAVARLEGAREAEKMSASINAEEKKLKEDMKEIAKIHAERTREEKKRMGELEKKAANIQSSVQEMKAAGTFNENSEAQVNQMMNDLRSEYKQIQEGQAKREQMTEEFARQGRARIEKQKAIASSPSLGAIDGLINLAVDSEGSAACRRCGTRPRTVRRVCSNCGIPFVAPPEMRDFVGIGEENLPTNILGLLERFEGDEARRNSKWKMWGEGYFSVKKQEARARQRARELKKETDGEEEKTRTSDKKEGEKKETSSANTTASKKADSSQEKSLAGLTPEENDAKLGEAMERLQPEGDYDRESYLEDQRALRAGDDPERRLFVQGLSTNNVAKIAQKADPDFTPDPSMSMTQHEAILAGVQEWEWNKSKDSDDVRAGDRVFMRREQGKITGYYTAGEHFAVDIPSDPESPEFDEAVDMIWDRIGEGMKDGKYYTKTALKSDLARNARGKKVRFTKITNPQPLDYQDEDLIGQPPPRSKLPPSKKLGHGTHRMNGGSRAEQNNQERTEKLARAAEENDARLVEKNGGSYPGSSPRKSKSKEKTKARSQKPKASRSSQSSTKKESSASKPKRSRVSKEERLAEVREIHAADPTITTAEMAKRMGISATQVGKLRKEAGAQQEAKASGSGKTKTSGSSISKVSRSTKKASKSKQNESNDEVRARVNEEAQEIKVKYALRDNPGMSNTELSDLLGFDEGIISRIRDRVGV
jgi:hypothetical protein